MGRKRIMPDRILTKAETQKRWREREKKRIKAIEEENFRLRKLMFSCGVKGK